MLVHLLRSQPRPETVAKKKCHSEQQHGHCLMCGTEEYWDSHQQRCDSEQNLEHGGMQQCVYTHYGSARQFGPGHTKPVQNDQGECGESEDTVIELHGRRVFKHISPERLHRKHSGRNPVFSHQWECVVYLAGLKARNKASGQDR